MGVLALMLAVSFRQSKPNNVTYAGSWKVRGPNPGKLVPKIRQTVKILLPGYIQA